MTERANAAKLWENLEKVRALPENSVVRKPKSPRLVNRKRDNAFCKSRNTLQWLNENVLLRLSKLSRSWANQSMFFVRRLQRERPLEALGAIASGGFLLGIFIRSLRRNRE